MGPKPKGPKGVILKSGGQFFENFNPKAKGPFKEKDLRNKSP